LSLLDRILDHLAGKGIAAALIGGFALAAHGVARATEDIDLLVLDRSVLGGPFWEGWENAADIEIRPGDLDDPLAGVVRVRRGGEVVDLVVGREPWMKGVLDRRSEINLDSRVLTAVTRADLVLLKLFAGGPQDLLDIELLLAADAGGLKAEVEQRLEGRSGALVKTWERVLMRSDSDSPP
jgi:hypothetical protein